MDRDEQERLRCCGTCYHYRLIGSTGGLRGCTQDFLLLRVGLHDACHLTPSHWMAYWEDGKP